MVTNILLLATGLLVAVDGYISWLVMRSTFYTREQKFAQGIIVWAIPVFGALLVWAFLSVDGKKSNIHPSGNLNDLEAGINLELDVGSSAQGHF